MSSLADEPGRPDSEIMAPPPWESVASNFQSAFPDLDQDQMRLAYEHTRNMRISQERYSNWEPPLVHHFAEAIPFVSSVRRWRLEYQAGDARNRIAAGQAQPDDYNMVAQFDRNQQLEQNRGVGAEVVATGRHVAGMVGEAYMGGAALRTVAGGGGLVGRIPGVAPALRWLGFGEEAAAPIIGTRLGTAQSARTVGGLLSQTGGELATEGARFAGHAAVQTAAMPSMYLDQWAQGNIQEGRDPLDIRGLPAAFVTGMAYVALLGTIGKQTSGIAPGNGVGSTLLRMGMAGPVGLIESQMVQVATGAAGLSTGYGPIGDIWQARNLEGNARDQKLWGAWKHALLTTMTFAAFAAIHEPSRPERARVRDGIMENFAERSRELARQGISRNRAGEILGEEVGRQAQEYAPPRYGPEEMGTRPEQQPSLSDFSRKPTPEARLPAEPARTAEARPEPRTPIPGETAPQATVYDLAMRVAKGEPIEKVLPGGNINGHTWQEVRRIAAEITSGKNVSKQGIAKFNTEPMTPEQASQALAREQARINVEGRNARPGTTQETAPPGNVAPASPEAKSTPEKPLSAPPSPRDVFAAHVRGEAPREAVNEAAKLSPKEAHAFWERWDGLTGNDPRTHADIGRDPEMRNAGTGAISRERVRQYEASAMMKLGLEGTMEKARAQAQELAARGMTAGQTEGDLTAEGRSERGNSPALDKPVERSGYEQTREATLESQLDKIIERLGDRSLPKAESDKLFKEYERLQARIEKGEADAESQRLKRAGEKPLAETDHREIDSRADQQAVEAERLAASQRTAADPVADAAKLGANEQPIAPDRPAGTERFGQPMTDAERARAQLGGGQENLAAGKSRPKGQTALANEVTDSSREREGRAPIYRQARRANPEVWDEAMSRIDADPGLPDRLVSELAARNRPTSREENAILLWQRVALANEHSRAITDYLDLSKQERQARRAGLNTTELQAKMKEADARETSIGDKINQLDKVIVDTGTEWGAAGQFRRQLVAEDYSLSMQLRKAEVAAKRPLTEEEHEQIRQMTDKIAEMQKKLDEAEKKLTEAGTGTGGKTYPEWLVARIQALEAMGAINEHIGHLRWQTLPQGEKILDWIKRTRVAFLISGPKTVGKVGMASAVQLATAPLREAIGSALRMIPGIRQIAELAPVEGRGFSGETELAAIKAAGKQGLKDAWDTIRTGQSELDVLYGTPRSTPRTWLDFFGSLHAAEKAPAVRGAYERAFQNIEASERAAGRNVTSPEALNAIGSRAYAESVRAKFMQDNAVLRGFEKMKKEWKNPENSGGSQALGHAADFLAPIVRTPTNIIADALAHIAGVPTGGVKAIMAWRKGLESLKPEEADTIMRLLKKGTLGIPLAALGYYLSKNAGGFYSGRRREDELQAGEFRVGNLTVPSWATSHHPAFMAIQFGAAIHRAEQDERHPDTSFVGATASSLGHLIDEVPLVREQREITNTLHFNADGLGRTARSFAIPQLFQWAAEQADRQQGRPDPRGFGQQIQTGVPFLRNRLQRRG